MLMMLVSGSHQLTRVSGDAAGSSILKNHSKVILTHRQNKEQLVQMDSFILWMKTLKSFSNLAARWNHLGSFKNLEYLGLTPRDYNLIDVGVWPAQEVGGMFLSNRLSSFSRVQLFATLWTAALQASLSFAISRSLLRLMSFESVMPSNHISFSVPALLLLPSIFPSVRVFSSELAQLAQILELQLQHQSFQWIFRVDFL